VAEIIVLIGSLFMFVGALGVAILRDSFQRFHAAGKVSLFGLTILILGQAFALHRDTGDWNLAAFIGVFILLFVGPFASHILARALYHHRKRSQ